jgi:hypothetical protein
MNEVTGAAVPLLPVALLPVLGGVPELLLPEPTTLPLPGELPEPWLTPLLLSVPEPGLATLPLPGELPEPALSPLPGVEFPLHFHCCRQAHCWKSHSGRLALRPRTRKTARET